MCTCQSVKASCRVPQKDCLSTNCLQQSLATNQILNSARSRFICTCHSVKAPCRVPKKDLLSAKGGLFTKRGNRGAAQAAVACAYEPGPIANQQHQRFAAVLFNRPQKAPQTTSTSTLQRCNAILQRRVAGKQRLHTARIDRHGPHFIRHRRLTGLL